MQYIYLILCWYTNVTFYNNNINIKHCLKSLKSKQIKLNHGKLEHFKAIKANHAIIVK